MVPAILADAHGTVLNFCPVIFGCEDFDDQRRDGENEPLDGPPPPADKQPPENTVMFDFQVGFRDHLDRDIFASALGTSHFLFLLSNISNLTDILYDTNQFN